MPQPEEQQQQQQSVEDGSEEAASENAAATLLLPGSRLRGPQPPPVNPLKFIKVSPPANLFKAPPVRELPPAVEKKEEPEAWQNDLEGWKFNRRKRQEQLMERVSEIKKSEEEQCNPSSRRNKTFSEMMKARKSSIVVYNEDNENDFSDLGLGSAKSGDSSGGEEVSQPSESEFTYEKAIQNYVEYASSRVNKPVISSNETTTHDTVVSTCVKETTEKITVKESVVVEEKMVEKMPRTAAADEINEIRETVNLAKRISMFERSDSQPSSLENHKDVPQLKKIAPPVPAKSKIIKKEEPFIMKQEIKPVAASQNDIVDNISSKKEESVETYCEEESTDLAAATTERAQESSENSSTVDIELCRTESTTESLKLMDTAPLDHVIVRDIQRSPLGGEDSGVHTADSVSQSDEVEEDEELPKQTDESINGLLGILSSQVPLIDHELSALLAPPSRLEPPKEKPPPPPPVCQEPDTESMRKSFLGLEFTPKPTVPAYEATTMQEMTDSDSLGIQLKERLLKLEEEKNNIINMEKHLKAEKQPSTVTANKDSADSQEKLDLEREALQYEREVIASKKQPTNFTKKLAFRSLESLDIPPLQDSNHELNNYYEEELTSQKNKELNTQNCNSTFKQPSERQQYYPDINLLENSEKDKQICEVLTENNNYAMQSSIKYHTDDHQSKQQLYETSPKQKVSDKVELSPNFDNHYQKSYTQQQCSSYHQQPPVYQQQQQQKQHSPTFDHYYTPPTPWYGDHPNGKQFYDEAQVNYYEPQSNEPLAKSASSSAVWTKQQTVINPAPPIRKKAPPPPAKPSRVGLQKQPLTRNYSADSILESVDGDNPVTLRKNAAGTSQNPVATRKSLPYGLGGSMSQLSNNNLISQPRQRPISQGINYQHWLVQEAEHRRITEQQQRQAGTTPRQPKHLPDAIIMSLTQRVQQRQSQIPPQRISPPRQAVDDKVLSVSGKKKCSHCNLELGRGAAMIIESLRLFYHIDCFKCCVCCIQLGDGLMGTDVRVRNGKLHCHSCYSSDDGVKVSCV